MDPNPKPSRLVLVYIIVVILLIYLVPRVIDDYKTKRLLSLLSAVRHSERANVIDKDLNLNNFEVTDEKLIKLKSIFSGILMLDKMKKEINPYIESKICDIKFNTENGDWITCEVWKLSYKIKYDHVQYLFEYYEDDKKKYSDVLLKVNGHYLSKNIELDEIKDILNKVNEDN